jgi:hypothetical protein
MQNQTLLNGASTLAVDGGKLLITRAGVDINNVDASRYVPMDVAGIYSMEIQPGVAGTSRSQTLTPTAANSTVYTVTVSVYKESDWGYFGPQLVTFSASFTSDASGTVAEITAGLTAAINLVGAAYGVTATDGTTLVTVTSNTTVPQNISCVSVGAGTLAVAQTVAFAKPYGLAAELQLRGLSSATTGQLYTKFVFKVKNGTTSGHVNTGSEFLEQTIWINTTQSTLITALGTTFRDAPYTTPAINL